MAPSTNSMVWIICREEQQGGSSRGDRRINQPCSADRWRPDTHFGASHRLHSERRTPHCWVVSPNTAVTLEQLKAPHLVHHHLAKIKLLAVPAVPVPARVCATGLGRRARVPCSLACTHALLVCRSRREEYVQGGSRVKPRAHVMLLPIPCYAVATFSPHALMLVHHGPPKPG